MGDRAGSIPVIRRRQRGCNSYRGVAASFFVLFQERTRCIKVKNNDFPMKGKVSYYNKKKHSLIFEVEKEKKKLQNKNGNIWK